MSEVDTSWPTYLKEAGELESYCGDCNCIYCQSVRDGYDGWKYQKTKAFDALSKSREEPAYPCDKCGKLRTIAEGGTTFTVCDECWDKATLSDGGGRG